MKIPLFDAHCDTISATSLTGDGLRENSLHTDLKRGMAYAPYAQIFAIFTRPMPETIPSGFEIDYTKPDSPPETLYSLYEGLLARLKSEFENNSDILIHCLTAADAKKAAEAGKIAAFISVEGAELLKCDRQCLRRAFDDGVRVVNITWNFDNALSGTAMGNTKSGLTQEGKSFIKYGQELGVIMDMSHISEKAFWDVMEITQKPVIASHSNSKSVFDHPRNLTDDQFKALSKTGGAAGLNLCAEFLSGHADIMSVVEHIEHFLTLGGEKSVCIGGDLDGVENLPEGIEGIQDMGKIYEALLKRNYGEDLVRDIFYNNLLDVFERAI